MSQLPVLRPREVARALERAGFERIRQQGSHAVFLHPDGRETVVPLHSSDLKRGTLAGILRQIKMSAEELMRYL